MHMLRSSPVMMTPQRPVGEFFGERRYSVRRPAAAQAELRSEA